MVRDFAMALRARKVSGALEKRPPGSYISFERKIPKYFQTTQSFKFRQLT